MKNMTEGKSLPLILQFALPLLIGNLLQQTYNMADAAIVGQFLGNQALGSVSASSSVQFFVLGFCIGVACGFGIPIAQRFGAGDLKGMRDCIFHGGILTLAIAVLLTTICALLCPQILVMMKTPIGLFEDAYWYLLILFLGIPCTLLYNMCSAVLRAVGDSRTPFVFLAISTVLNIGLDFLCILVLQWGCAGAAIATITSQGISGLLCFFYINMRVKDLRMRKENMTWSWHLAGLMIRMGVPMGLQYSITAIGTMVMQAANNGISEIAVSGFAAATKIKQLTMCPFDAIATAVSTFAGQNLGAGKTDRIKKCIREGVAIDASYGLIIGIVMIFLGKYMVRIFINMDEENAMQVWDAATFYLKCAGGFYWSLGFLNVCRMTTQGIGYSGRAVFSGVVEMVARIVVATVFVPMFGFNAICFCDQSAWVSACFYIIPTLIYCLKKAEKKVKERQHAVIA